MFDEILPNGNKGEDMTLKDVKAILTALSLVGVMTLVGCLEPKQQKILVKYHQKFEVQDDFYGHGDCIMTGAAQAGFTHDSIAIYGNCKFDSGYSGSVEYGLSKLKLK